MNLEFIGIGGAFNSDLGCNCAYIKEEDKILFIDFGMDVFDKVVKYNLLDGIKNVYVCLTHFHGDHIGGLFTFIDYCYFNKNIVVQILNNSITFTNVLVKLLEFTGIESTRFSLILPKELNFKFSLNFVKTEHSPLLECYSLIFKCGKNKILYTSDSNDINFVKECIKDESFVKIYCEVGENSPVHIEYEDLKKLKSDKLILMHFQSVELYDRAIRDGFKVPIYLK